MSSPEDDSFATSAIADALRFIVITQSKSAYFLRHLRFETSLHIVWQDKSR